ncbi:hypothetical protein H5410_012308 [Solanum commersonii]|uniref:Uncharacterized protein n=1 Tax=Solanum commersonii TaxID=4109 RepID=A0A9J6AS94_SOLCO|nr:hypothetical protein H5410_012308 [Solanum commersonii]
MGFALTVKTSETLLSLLLSSSGQIRRMHEDQDGDVVPSSVRRREGTCKDCVNPDSLTLKARVKESLQ